MDLGLGFLSGKKICVTGGTGSFGRAFVEFITLNSEVSKIVILSRDEIKQWEMGFDYSDDDRVQFVIGDVRDLQSVKKAVRGCDFVVHAAATKIVPIAETNPRECIRTNVDGALNVIDACYDEGVSSVVALSTDKASSPANLYGASKLVSDKLFVAADTSGAHEGTRFCVARYGNVMGSRGSVIPFFLECKQKGSIPITDPMMSRFMITMDQAIEVVVMALKNCVGGEIFVRKIPSMTVAEIAEAIVPDIPQKIIGKRPGEKMHEQMIGVEDSSHTLEFESHFVILPHHNDDERRQIYLSRGGKVVPEDFIYVSNTNNEGMSKEKLRQFCEEQGWL